MRILFTAAFSAIVIVLGNSPAWAQKEAPTGPQDKQKVNKPDADKKAGSKGEADPEKPGPKLKAGDRAPELKADKWLRGKEVDQFVAGKVYVVEFWATWCGPCIAMMPHLSELQKEYRSKDLTIIGFTAKDPRNSDQQVTDFVTNRGEKLGYTFAYSDGRATYDAWMKAAGQSGIPCSFVVDKKGNIAYIGHPMYLDAVLPGVLAGTWQPEDGPALIASTRKDQAELNAALKGDDTKAAIKAIKAFNAKHPGLAHLTFFTGPQLSYLVKAKLFSQTREMLAESLDRAVKSEDVGMLQMLSNIAATAAKSDREVGLLGLKSAEAALQIAGDDSWQALLSVAEAHFSLGEQEKALEYVHKTLERTKDPRIKDLCERRIKRYEENK